LSTALVIIAIVAAVIAVATGGILSVKPAYAIVPNGSGPCTASVCPGASGLTPGLDLINGVHANVLARTDLPPGIAAHTPQ
jgi:hypothetical protein